MRAADAHELYAELRQAAFKTRELEANCENNDSTGLG
jgi:hypothetical protein